MYLLTFFVAITLNWALPRMMPGDPLVSVVAKLSRSSPGTSQKTYEALTKKFGFDKPLATQYAMYLKQLTKGDLGISTIYYPKKVTDLIMPAIPYSLVLTIPAILLAFILGNKLGAAAARKKMLDNRVLPIWYVLTATPYFWLAILLAWFFGTVLKIFPIAMPYSGLMKPNFSLPFIGSFLYHWILPFLSLFIVQLGGWAIGMRNIIIYELESDYSRYLRSLGTSDKLIRKYAFNNAKLPQITGLATQLGAIVVGNITTEVVFQYPGIGRTMVEAILQQDYLVAQGAFLLLVLCVLVANFAVDIAYAFIDPRIRYSVAGD